MQIFCQSGSCILYGLCYSSYTNVPEQIKMKDIDGATHIFEVEMLRNGLYCEI